MIIYQSNQSILLQPCGRLDLEGSTAFKQQLIKLTVNQCNLWVIDLSLIDFIDSAGLSALIAGFKLANRSGSRFVLRNLHPSVKLVLEITQLERVFEIANSETDAELLSCTTNTPRSATVGQAA